MIAQMVLYSISNGVLEFLKGPRSQVESEYLMVGRADKDHA